MQLVTASLTAVFRSDSSSIRGSSCETNEETTVRANDSLTDLAGNTH